MNARLLALLAALVFVVGVTWFVKGRTRATLSRGKTELVESAQPVRIESSTPSLVESAPLLPAREVTPSRASESPAAEDEDQENRLGLDAHLSVEVVALETGEPIADANLSVDPAREQPAGDARGRFEFTVPAGQRLQLTVFGPTGKAGSCGLEVEPLAAGESRELRIELATAFDVDWFGRIVDGEGGEPIAGARVDVFALIRPVRSGTAPADPDEDDVSVGSAGAFVFGGKLESFPRLVDTTTDGDGRLVLRLPSWAIDVARFGADGYFSRSLAGAERRARPGPTRSSSCARSRSTRAFSRPTARLPRASRCA